MCVEKSVPLPVVTQELPEGDSPAARIKRARLVKEKTIRELAEETGLTPEGISKIENEWNPPSLPTLRKLSEVLGVSVCYLGCFEGLPENTLGQWIMKGRLCAGLTKEELARLIEVDPTAILRWERDGGRPSEGYLEKLKRYIKI